MYNEHFGFLQTPFTTTPNPRFFYSNRLYREALANLRYGIEWRKGLIVMTGEVGTGKTTLLCKTIHTLESTVRPIFVSYDQLTSIELLRVIVRELRLPFDPQDRVNALERLRSYLLQQQKKRHTVALLIDEAQNLSDQMFEDIRFLSNFETEEEKLLQIVLTGQPELDARLDHPHLRHIRQRIVLHCRLEPLAADEAGPYIETRLAEAGYRGKELFNRDAAARVAAYSGGIPRLINIICDNALLVAYAQSERSVNVEMVEEVARDLGLRRLPMNARPVSPLRDYGVAVERASGPPRECAASWTRQTPRLTLVTAGLSLVLITIGTSGRAFYSWPITGYFNQTARQETGHGTASAPAKQVTMRPSPASLPGRTAREPSEEKTQTASAIGEASKKHSSARSLPPPRKNTDTGRFTVAGATSFLRSSPEAGSRIIATLAPGAQVTVLDGKGSYLRVQTSIDGRRLRGYVHREDAFFEPIRNNRGRRASAR